MVASAAVVGDEPHVCFGLELAGGAEVPAVKGGAPALLEHGALEPLADHVVIGRAGGDSFVPDPVGRQGFDEGAGHILATIVGQDRSDAHPVTAIQAQCLVDKAGAHSPGDRAEDDGDDGEAGEDIDGGELVHLAHTLELADVRSCSSDEPHHGPSLGG